jgi:predicted dinucleotide-binding enzyme
MRIGVLGTGVVGQTIGTKLVELGHNVTMGARSAGNEKAVEWAAGAGEGASEGSFADAAAHGELVFNCTAGTASLDALRSAGEEELRGKVLVDVANPLDFSKGMPPTLTVCDDDSLGEQIQRAFPESRVVKTLNTVSSAVMVDPIVGTNLFLCGDDAAAKQEVVELLAGFGWPAESFVDLGGIDAARGPEMYLALWIRLMGAQGTPAFNIAIVP